MPRSNSDKDTPSNVIPFTPSATPASGTPANVTSLNPSSAPGTVPSGNAQYKILVTEDEPDARTMFVDLLASEGYDVSSAVDGVDALAKVSAEKFNLILLDIVMPNKDGVEVLQEIKSDPEKYGQPTVVMLTNISGDAAVEKAMELGAVGYKLKIGTEPEQLLQDVADFLSGKVQNVKTEPISTALAA